MSAKVGHSTVSNAIRRAQNCSGMGVPSVEQGKSIRYERYVTCPILKLFLFMLFLFFLGGYRH